MNNPLKHWMMVLTAAVMIAGLSAEICRASDERSPFQAVGDDSRIILRWVWPENSLTAPDYTISRQEKGATSWQVITPAPVSKVDSREKAEKALGREIFETYEPLLFPEIPDPQKDPAGFRNRVRHMGAIRGMTMLVADMHPAIADLLGVRWVDRDVKNGRTYVYRLAVLKDGKQTMVGTSEPVTPGKTAVPPPGGFKGKPSDSAAFHRWQVEPGFTAYDLYRSNKEKGLYEKVNTAPIVIVSTKDKEGTPRYPEWFYTDKNLKNGITYWYTVQGRDPFGRKSGFAKPLALTPADDTPPGPPLKFAADVKKSTVILTWENNEDKDLAGYNIYRSLDCRTGFEKANKTLLSTGATTYVDNDLPMGKNWWYYATAVDKSGNESPGSYTALADVRDCIPPVAPRGLTGKARPGKVLLSWQSNLEKDIKGYRIYQSMDKNADGYHLLNREPESRTDYVTPLPETADAGPYFYKITAVDTAGNESLFSDVVEVQLPDVTPPFPPVFKAVDVQEREIRLTWHENTEIDLAGYNLYRNEKKHPKKQDVKLNETLLSAKTTIFADTFNLTAGTRYTYTLEAVDNAGNPSRRSGILTAATYDRTPPGPPTQVKTRPMGGEVIQVSWQLPNADDLKGVLVFRAEQKEGPFYPVTDITKETVFLDASVKQGKHYYYRLAAFDRSSNRSGYSGTIIGIVEKKPEKP